MFCWKGKVTDLEEKKINAGAFRIYFITLANDVKKCCLCWETVFDKDPFITGDYVTLNLDWGEPKPNLKRKPLPLVKEIVSVDEEGLMSLEAALASVGGSPEDEPEWQTVKEYVRRHSYDSSKAPDGRKLSVVAKRREIQLRERQDGKLLNNLYPLSFLREAFQDIPKIVIGDDSAYQAFRAEEEKQIAEKAKRLAMRTQSPEPKKKKPLESTPEISEEANWLTVREYVEKYRIIARRRNNNTHGKNLSKMARQRGIKLFERRQTSGEIFSRVYPLNLLDEYFTEFESQMNKEMDNNIRQEYT